LVIIFVSCLRFHCVNYYFSEGVLWVNLNRLFGSWKRILLFVAFFLILIVSVVIVFGLFSQEEETNLLHDSEYDVFLSIGEGDLGLIDLTSASLEVVDDQLIVVFSTREPILVLSQGEVAQYGVLLILANESDVIWSFEFRTEVNSTGLYGFLEDIETGDLIVQDLLLEQNKVTAYVDISGYEVPTMIEWGISTSYEEYLGEDLVTIGFDYAPDDVLHTTYLEE